MAGKPSTLDPGSLINQKGVVPIPTLDPLQKAALAARLADEKKAEDIVILDVRGLCNFTDAFVICTGNSRVQLNAICQGVTQGFKKAGFKSTRDDQDRRANWMALDFGDVVVHVMSSEARGFYRLERLWGDAAEVEVDFSGVAASAGG